MINIQGIARGRQDFLTMQYCQTLCCHVLPASWLGLFKPQLRESIWRPAVHAQLFFFDLIASGSRFGVGWQAPCIFCRTRLCYRFCAVRQQKQWFLATTVYVLLHAPSMNRNPNTNSAEKNVPSLGWVHVSKGDCLFSACSLRPARDLKGWKHKRGCGNQCTCFKETQGIYED